MSKKGLVVSALIFVSAALFAIPYNPPAGGQNIYRLVSPTTLTSASSTGGAIQNVAPSTVTENPAIAAFEQRAILDVGGTILINNKDYANFGPGFTNDNVGSAFQLGALFPTRLFVYTADLQGVFVPFPTMHLGNTITATGSVSKDITKDFSIGLALRGGALFGNGTDWTLAADIGAYYELGKLAFMKDFRFGVVVKNLGKIFTKTELEGMAEDKTNYAASFPALGTLKVGAACTFVEKENVQLGGSLDFAFPMLFMDMIIDAGVMVNINVANACTIGIQSCWQADLNEMINGRRKNLIPTFGVSAKFLINANKSEFMAKKGWGQSEISAHTAYANLYEDTNAVSFQAIMHLGSEDTEAPKIILWDEEQ